MTKSKFKEMPRYLILASTFIIILTTIGFILIIPDINSEIDNAQLEISNVTKESDRLIFNAQMNSDQLVKMGSTYGTYKILNELNSSDKDEFKEHLKYEIVQSIVILRGDGLNSTERDYYFNLTILELEKEFKKQNDIFRNEWAENQNLKSELEKELIQLKNERNEFSSNLAIFQIFGLVIGFLGGLFKEIEK